MTINGKGFVTRALMLAMALFVALPAVTLASGLAYLAAAMRLSGAPG